MLLVVLRAIKDKGSRELFMASFTNNPLCLHLQCWHGLCSFIYGDSFAPRTVDTFYTPFEEGWAGPALTEQQQQQQRGIMGCMALRYYLSSQWEEFGWLVMEWGARGVMWACTWLQWHDGRWHAHAAAVLSLLLRVKLHIDRGPSRPPRHTTVSLNLQLGCCVAAGRCAPLSFLFCFFGCCCAYLQANDGDVVKGRRENTLSTWMIDGGGRVTTLIYIFSVLVTVLVLSFASVLLYYFSLLTLNRKKW